MDDSKQVQQVLKEFSDGFGCNLHITHFVRMQARCHLDTNCISFLALCPVSYFLCLGFCTTQCVAGKHLRLQHAVSLLCIALQHGCGDPVMQSRGPPVPKSAVLVLPQIPRP